MDHEDVDNASIGWTCPGCWRVYPPETKTCPFCMPAPQEEEDGEVHLVEGDDR